MKPKPQNLIWNTPPFCFAKSGGFTGDQQYSPPRYGPNLFLMLLTSVASRGRPVRSASESSFAQRGEAAQSKTTPHSPETQAPVFGGCLYSSLIHPGPKARKAGQQNQGMGAGRKKGFFVGRPWGPGPKPRRFFGYFCISTKVPRPGAKLPHSPVPPAGDAPASVFPCRGGPKGPPYNTLNNRHHRSQPLPRKLSPHADTTIGGKGRALALHYPIGR